MNRLGFNWQDASKVASIPDLKFLDIKYVMSHLACIVEDDHALNKDQLIRINDVRKNFPDAPVTLANSKGIVAGKCYHFDMVRPGSALYGIRGSSKTLALKNVVTAKAKILQIRDVLEDGFVGYGATQAVKKGTRLAVCPLGYADGYLRSLSHNTFAFYDGIKLPLVGRVSMDMTIFDISDVPADEIKVGDELELFGDNYKVDEVARHAGTIGYEILTNLGCRYKRVYK
jgi:alanine racemase